MAGEKVLLFGDIAVPTGFGRIGAYAGRYLSQRGYQVMGACVQYDGLLPHGLPFWVAAMGGKEFWSTITNIVGAYDPDVIVSLQDFPYHDALRHNTGIDWSRTAHVVVTPIDGTPINEAWLPIVDEVDGFMTISEFGVQAFRDNGKRVDLCPPGVDTNEFYRLPDDKRAELRARLGIPADAFVVGMMAMNQGRKDFPGMVEGFWEAFKDIPNAYLYLDCEKASPAGWDIPKHLIKVIGVDPARIRYREDAGRAGITSLNERYNLLDLHGVMAFREGYGLPHTEAAATKCPSMAIDYCSGREVTGSGEHGLLIKATPGRIGTWGGARDYNADIQDLARQMRAMFDNRAELAALGERAYKWAQSRTWDNAGAAVERVIKSALTKRAADLAKKREQPKVQPTIAQPQIPAGITNVVLQGATIFVNANNAVEMARALGQMTQQAVDGAKAGAA